MNVGPAMFATPPVAMLVEGCNTALALRFAKIASEKETLGTKPIEMRITIVRANPT